MDLKIIEKPLFFLGFFNILRKALEEALGAFGHAWWCQKGHLEEPKSTPGRAKKASGTPWRAFRYALEGLWGRQGRPNAGPSQERPTQGRAKVEMATQQSHARGDNPRPLSEIILLIISSSPI